MLVRFREAMAQRYFGTSEHPGYKYLVSGSDPLLMRSFPKRSSPGIIAMGNDVGGIGG
jgi:hypothetical protein